jgi:asparagine synthase (glutamine-hydrolysing)
MFMGWHVYREATRQGLRVMLIGQGGDEVLLGYDRYYAAMLRCASRLEFLRQLWLQSRHSNLSPLKVLEYYLYFTNARVRSGRLKARSHLKPEIKQAHDFAALRRSVMSFRNIDELQKLEIESVQLPRLLRYDDRNSMRHAIETRMPFLDYRLVELALSLPATYKINEGWRKHVLREAFRDSLPEQIISQRLKIGFEAPEKTWLDAENEGIKKEILQSRILDEIVDKKGLCENFTTLSTKEQWAYFNLAVWERVYRVSW